MIMSWQASEVLCKSREEEKEGRGKSDWMSTVRDGKKFWTVSNRPYNFLGPLCWHVGNTMAFQHELNGGTV